MLFILIGSFACLVAGAPLVKSSPYPIVPALRANPNSSPCPYPSAPIPSPNSLPTLHVDSLPSSKTSTTILTPHITLPVTTPKVTEFSNPECIITHVALPDERCGRVAARYGISLSPTDTYYAASSLTCTTALRQHGVCLNHGCSEHDSDCNSRLGSQSHASLLAWSGATRRTTSSTRYPSPQPPFRNASMTSTTPAAGTGTGTVSFARSPVPTQLRPTTTVVKGPVASNKPQDVYHAYTGDGSIAAGWPSIRKWISFDALWRVNLQNMKISCDQWQVPRNSDLELDELKRAIFQVSAKAGLDPRFVLAVVLQESQACVRVITTANAHPNPGLMQSFDGQGSCNEGGQVQTPCPYSEIHQMIKDGTTGTSSGPGLLQDYQVQGRHGGAAYYRTARIYNSGSIPPDQNLSGSTGATVSYASDIANRLTGWVYAPRTFNG